jgi:D-psicose/D-tagatose/L-ribulose 3-epimerase
MIVPPVPSHSRLRFGCCGSMIAPATDPVGIAIVEDLAAFGYDYIELSLRDLAVLSEPGLVALTTRLRSSGLPCEVCNNFFPPEIRLTGPAADLPAALRYAEPALATAARVGASVVIFGSSGARNVPDGFPLADAWLQLRLLLIALAPLAARHGITIALEHLNRGESNILNTVAETSRLAREIAHSHVRLLLDAYHLLVENESLAILAQVAPDIAHVHVAQGTDRFFPAGTNAPLAAFFSALRATGYTQRCSVEAYPRDFPIDAPRALATCRTLATA